MVDSNDRERIGEAREELMRMLAEDELREAVLLIFANKQVSSYLKSNYQNFMTLTSCLYDCVGLAQCYECCRNH